MSDALFEFGDPPAASVASTPLPARDEQVVAMRAGLDRAGIVSQRDRQAFIESVILVPVASLRDLTAIQARRVIERLKERQAPRNPSTGNLWVDREKDTWIDRL